uniref:Uncharacterized protein n=1 Tax=Fagus sylvatica TaxID=28930 RepID=A0A2N9EXT0_FAGSY
MLLGFISLLLTVFQGLVSRICIPAYLASIMLPCKKGTVSASGSEHYSNLTKNNRRRLLSEDTNSGHCLHEGKVPLLSLEALHQLHIFIFVLAVVHVIFCVTTMFLGGYRIRQWKVWEESEKGKNTNAYQQYEFVRHRGIGYWRKAAIIRTISALVAEIQNSTEDGMMPNPDLAAWTRTDRLIKAWITATISEEALGTVVGLTTSLDVWKALSNTYSQDSQAREFELLLKLQEKKKDMVPLNDFIRNFKLTCDQLNAIGKPVPDQKKVFWLLNGLGSRYESFSTTMLKPPVPSYLDLIPLLHSHELRNKSFLIDQPNPAVAFVGQRFNSNKGPQSSFNSRGKGFHQSGSRPPIYPTECSATIFLQKSNSVRFDNSYQDDHVPQALAALHLNSPVAGEWVPDTGATAHITDDPGSMDTQSVGIGGVRKMVFMFYSVLQFEFSSPINSVAERKHRHVVELGLAMLLHASAPKYLWVEAFLTATFLINRLPSPSLGMHSPCFLLHQKKPTYDFLRTFGSQCFPYLRSYAKDKLEPRSLPCIFVGYSDKHKGYRCLHLSTGRVYTSRHVVFDETSFPFAPAVSVPQVAELVPTHLADWTSPSPAPILSPTTPSPAPDLSPTLDKDYARLFSPQNPDPIPPISSLSPEISDPVPSPSQIPSPHPPLPTPSQQPHHSMTTRSRLGIIKPNPKYALAVVSPPTPAEPKTVKSALHDPGWRAAMNDEMQALHQNHTWVLVPRQADMNIIGCRWIFKTKLHSDGSLDRLKARLVAKGYNQQEGVDYLDTFSPVIRPATIRIVLTLATVKGWSLRQLDVKNAFLHGHLDTTVFMDQPPGFVDSAAPTHVCLLKRALYGLKQAPRAWFDRFSSFLIDFGFFCSSADSSLFIYKCESHILILLVYVDDIIPHGKFGFSTGSICVSAGCSTFSPCLNMLDCKPVATPMASKRVSLPQGDTLFSDLTEYRRIVGTLQYLTLTRPDLSYAGTLSLGIRILRKSSLDLFAFSDADWVGCPITRRSTTGFCTFLGSNCISWSAKKQPTVSRSSTEAEYRAMASTAAELTWLSFILRDIGIYQAQPPTLFCDNLSALHMSVNPDSSYSHQAHSH